MDLSYIEEMDRDELLHEIGRLILEDKAYKHGGWRAISVIMTEQPAVGKINGFFYPEDGGRPKSVVPGQFSWEIGKAALRLRKLMQDDTQTEWVQMLYQIWLPGPGFSATFENENPARWSLSSKDIKSVQDFADMVDPAKTRSKG